MNVKKQIKKVAAVGASVAIAATTMVSALAYDLSDYPAPFVEDGVFNGAIVVGATAATQDVLGAIDIAASLQAESKSGVMTGGTQTVVEGAEDIEDIAIGGDSGAVRTLDDADLEGFEDDEIEVNDNDYDYVEQIIIDSNALSVGASYQNSWDEDENYGDELYLEIAEEGVSYRILFDTPVLDADGDADEFEIDFLGREITVVNWANGSSDTITVEASNEYYLEEGDSVTVDGKEVTLLRVGESSVLVDVDGQSLAVEYSPSKETEEFDQSDDFKVKVENAFYIEGDDSNAATLSLGNDIQNTYANGDALEIFDGEDDEDVATWLWEVNVDGSGNLVSFGVTNTHQYEKTGVTDDDDDRGALPIGEKLDFGGYAAISIAGFSEPEMSQYGTLDIDFDNDNKDDAEALNAGTSSLGSNDYIVLGSDNDDDFVITFGDDSTQKAGQVFITHESAVPYVFFDDGDEEYFAGELNYSATVASQVKSIELVLDNEAITFQLDDNATPGSPDLSSLDGSDFLQVDFNGVETLTFDIRGPSTGYDQFGATPNEGESSDVDSSVATRLTGTLDEPIKLVYGTFIEDPEALLDSDEFSMMVPFAQQTVDFVVESRGSVVSSSSEGASAYNVNPIGLGLGILDTDAPALGSKPMIVVGGPYANTVAAELLGNPTPEQISETFTDGRAGIWWFEDQQAMLVAGWSAQDTQGATYVVAKYDQYDLSGDEVEVIVTSLDNIRVNQVS